MVREMVLFINSSDLEFARFIGECLVLLMPFLLFALVVGYVLGCFIKDPWAAAFASGLVGVSCFWATLVGAIAIFVGGGAGATAGAIDS